MGDPTTLEPHAFSDARTGAEGLDAAIDEFVEFVGSLPDEQWNARVPIEERSVRVMAYHIANALRLGSAWLERARRGEPIPGDDLDVFNAEEALEHAGATREEVLELVNRQRGPAVETLRSLTEAEWEITVPFGPGGGIELPVSRLASAAERHIRVHLGHIHEALEAN